MAAANIENALSDDLDYEIWAPTAKTTLIEKGLWDVVENGVPPDPLKIPELAATIQAEELSKWRDLAVKDMKALQILQSSLTDSAFRKTLSVSSAKDVWDLLEKGNEETKLRKLEKQFEELRMGERESVDSYFDRVTEIAEQFHHLKHAKSEYQVIKKVLASLSGSYVEVAQLLEELMDVHNMTFKSLVEIFHGYESISIEDIDLMLKQNRLKSQSKSERLWGLCHKQNHNEEDCDSIPKTENSTEEEEIEADYLLLTDITLGDLTYDEDIWMVYGNATHHMTPYEKYFTILDRTHKAKVGLVDGTVMMVEGRGDIKIVMKEGKKKTISNVLFVPGFNRNVLSVRQITERGCSFSEGRRGECIIRDRTGKEFGETIWMRHEKGLALRLHVIEGNITS